MSTQYETGEGYVQYQAQVGPNGDILAVPGYASAGNILVPGGFPGGLSSAGNNATAQAKFLAQAQAAGRTVDLAQGIKGVPETPSTTYPQGDASKNTPAIFDYTPERYTV